jgi:hypothetical protein
LGYAGNKLAIGVHKDWPELASIINKSLSVMTSKEHAKLRQSALIVRFVQGVDTVLVIKLVGGILFVLLLVSLWLLYVRRQREPLHNLNRELRMISSCDRAMIHTADDLELLNEVCRIVVEDGDHPLAWVGYLVKGQDQTIQAVAHAGGREAYINQTIRWINSSGGLSIQAIKTSEPIIIQDIQSERKD